MSSNLPDFKKIANSKIFLVLDTGFFLLLIASIIGFLQPIGNIMWDGDGRFYKYSSYIAYWSVIQYSQIVIPAMLILSIGILFIFLKYKSNLFALSSLLFFSTFLTYLYWALHMPPDWSIQDTGFSIEMLVNFEFLLGLAIIMTNFSLLFFGLGLLITRDIRKPAKGLSICNLICIISAIIFFIWNALSLPRYTTYFGLDWNHLIMNINIFLLITCVLNLFALLSENLQDYLLKYKLQRSDVIVSQ